MAVKKHVVVLLFRTHLELELIVQAMSHTPSPATTPSVRQDLFSVTYITLEVLNISLEAGTAQVNYPVFTANCPNRTRSDLDVSLTRPFTFSDTDNRFTAMGCDNLAKITQKGSTIGGCTSFCNTTSKENSCFGVNCCQTRIPPSLAYMNITLSDIDPKSDQKSCKYAFIVDQSWFGNLTNIYRVQSMEKVPALLNWKTYGGCKSFTTLYPSVDRSLSLFAARHSSCSDGLCLCENGYEGNPYLLGGCQAIDYCSMYNTCTSACVNVAGGYKCSIKSIKSQMAVVGTSTGIIVIILIICTWGCCKAMKRRKRRKLRKKFFKRNGGMLLQQQVTSGENSIDKTKLFTSKELEKATDRFNKDRILGRGGQGTVYKGMLTDGRIIAVKKSILEAESKLEQFINEVVILSQINHRHIVKLHGCCLETEIPLLVYEFIPNGTLYQYILDQNEEFPLLWDASLRVATEVAGALFYLHSAASIPIYHRDIKSSNILLDEKYRIKVADFGTSKSISINQNHLTTRVQGTFGYLDPEYSQTSQYTEKSDVYSFGVVLVELLTGKKPILPARSDDGERSLTTLFILAMEENRLFDILDPRVKDGQKEEIMAFAELAYRCLSSNGRQRPTMRQVTSELGGMSTKPLEVPTTKYYEEIYAGSPALWDTTSISEGRLTSSSAH